MNNIVKQWHKLWSVWLSALGALIMGIFSIWPESILQLWAAMPEEVRSLIPDQMVSYIALFIFVMTAIARITKQSNLIRSPSNDTTTDEEQHF